MNNCWFSVYLLTLIAIVNGIIVDPNDTMAVDDFLCNCSDDCNIHLLPGRHVFQVNNYSCYLTNKTSIMITGNSADDTIIDCKRFSIVLAFVQNVTISNLTFEGCGGGMEDYVDNSFRSFVHLGNGSRFVFFFITSANVTFSNVRMQNTLGYSIIAFDLHGIVKLLGVHIKNTLFQNDNSCIGYDYEKDDADFSCSGSGVMFVYRFRNSTNDSLIINNCIFENNSNIIPLKHYDTFRDAINIGYYRSSIPLVGAGCIALYFTQTDFPLRASITNTMFFNNSGSYSASVAITSVYSVLSQTTFENCTFMNNNYNSTLVSLRYPYQNGGIKLLYLIVIGDDEFPNLILHAPTESEMLTITQCNFMRVGGAIHIEKLAPNNLTIVVRLHDCNFTDNKATTGPVFTALEKRFRSSAHHTTVSAIRIFMTDVNAVNNALLDASYFVAGVFVLYNVQVEVVCNKECEFYNNCPSVFYGLDSEVTLKGNMSFERNEATNGGALRILNTVVFIHAGANLWFTHNRAVVSGGAFNIDFTNTNVETQDVCPIQFVGLENPIFDLKELGKLNVSINFHNNTVGSHGTLESIFCNVFYRCSWFTDTSVQINLGVRAPVDKNDRRLAVYRSVLTFDPPDSADNHIYTQAYLPCPCDSDGSYNFTACSSEQIIKLDKTVIPGRLFNISLVTVDIVGSVGYSRELHSQAFEDTVFDKKLILGNGQNEQPFSLVNRSCTSVMFTIYSTGRNISNTGILRLSFLTLNPSFLNLQFTIMGCPVGFQKKLLFDNVYGCVCDTFFERTNGAFLCNNVSGFVIRLSPNAWLSTNDDRVEYNAICSPNYCHKRLITFDLSEEDVLCTNHHSGRVCGGCEDGFSRVFGSDTCKKCDNAWLATIVLYAILGIILVLILFLLKFTITLGIVSGIIFFCNIISINDQIFFSSQISRFSFLRVFISLINLDLGFEICFYDGMSQLAKSGLQFVVPVYLWLLMMVIVYAHKRILIQTNLHTIQVFATLLLLSYTKLLHAIIQSFAFVTITTSTGSSTAWQPDPDVSYLTGGHIALFIVAFLLLIFYIIPFAVGLTFPNRFIRFQKISYYLYPLVDCFAAPYKDKYRYWFGARALLLIYLTGAAQALSSDETLLLLSNIFVVGFFAFVQAFILPFKTQFSNVLDLALMGIFLILSIATRILYPNEDNVNIAVKILGIKHTSVGEQISFKLLKIKEGYDLLHKFFKSVDHRNDQNRVRSDETNEFIQYRESFLQHDNYDN